MRDKQHKHVIKKSNAELKSQSIVPTLKGGGRNREKKKEILEIPKGWKEPILESIERYQERFSYKLERREKVIKNYSFDISILSEIEANIFEIKLYKIATDNFIKDFFYILGYPSLVFIKKDFGNTSLIISLNYQDSLDFISRMKNACESPLEKKEKILKFISGFELLDQSNLWLFIDISYKAAVQVELSPQIIKDRFQTEDINVLAKKIKELANSFQITIEEIIRDLDGQFLLKIKGNYKYISEFLSIFELFSAVYSEEIRTITRDISGAGDLQKFLKIPEVKDFNEYTKFIPKVILLDSNLPTPEVLNPILEGQILNEYETEYSQDPANQDHSIQMASIICFGEQLSDLDNGDLPKELESFSKIDVVTLGNKPTLDLFKIPSILSEIKEGKDSEQLINICNFSANLKEYKKECEGLSRFTFEIDKFLFFNTNFSFNTSVGNIQHEELTDLNFHSQEASNIFIPADGLNIISVGALTSMGEVSKLSRKNSFDFGRISNDIRDKSILNNKNVIRFKSKSKIFKPDILTFGENWNPATQEGVLSLYNKKNGTSHATAYLSHLSAFCLGIYPELKSSLGLEAILLHNPSNTTCNFSIDSSLQYAKHIKNRVDELNSKKTEGNIDWLEKENEFIQDRLLGQNIAPNKENIFNTKNQKTFVIEGEIGIGERLVEKIDLKEFITTQILDESQLSFSGTLSFKGIPYLKDSIGVNVINIRAKFCNYNSHILSEHKKEEFSGEDDENYKGECNKPNTWSSSNVCDYQWGTKQKFKRTTQTELIKKDLLENNLVQDIIIECVGWRNRDYYIKNFFKQGLKKYFPSKGDCPQIWKEFYDKDISKLSDIKIPYALCITVQVNSKIDLYGEAEAEIEIANRLF